MKIQFYGYNAFLIESGDKLLAIDPGALFFYWFRFTTLFPKSKWHDITHIFITHGDPDHYWHADRVAKASNASVIFLYVLTLCAMANKDRHSDCWQRRSNTGCPASTYQTHLRRERGEQEEIDDCRQYMQAQHLTGVTDGISGRT